MYYGYSYKPGDTFSRKYIMFKTESEAQKWLNTEESDFRTREYGNRDWAIEEWGEDEVCRIEDSDITGKYL